METILNILDEVRLLQVAQGDQYNKSDFKLVGARQKSRSRRKSPEVISTQVWSQKMQLAIAFYYHG